MEKIKFRPSAVPLIANDPMFNVYSFASNLYDDTPRHWTGLRQGMIGVIVVDGIIYEFLGMLNPDNRRYFTGYRKLTQKDVTVRPLSTIYVFENDKIELTLKFISPLLLNDLKLMSYPVTYMTYEINSKDNQKHDCHLYFGFSSEFVVNNIVQKAKYIKTDYSDSFSSGDENMLKRYGDDHKIEWGSFHVISSKEYTNTCMPLRQLHTKIRQAYVNRNNYDNYEDYEGPNIEELGPTMYQNNEEFIVGEYLPFIVSEYKFELVNDYSNYFILAYDDIKCISYYGENLDAYYKKDGTSFEDMIKDSIERKDEIFDKVISFEDELLSKANKISTKYADLLSLAFRQSVSGHKLTYKDDEILFLSKECYSNGCIATVDVTYPSIPLFLIYNPKLVEGMLNPIFKLIEKGLWEYDFAPHDVGRYPIVDKQIYGYDERYKKRNSDPMTFQMPIEECGNMILCVAAICLKDKKFDYFIKHKDILIKWADYLANAGYDPNNQLCTDDFAGHLAHNCNLSCKAICALGAISKCLNSINEIEKANYYYSKAKEFAKLWEENAIENDHYKLAFDAKDTWSIKYNMVFDKMFSLDLFNDEVYKKELNYYKKQIHKYGLPLDSRCDYTKSDWQMWSTMLFDDIEYTNMIIDAMWDFQNETNDRLPFSDLYFTSIPMERGFQARTVQGGLFINLLKFDI